MKKNICLILFLMSMLSTSGQRIIFLHHSTGEGVYNGGAGLPEWFSEYNSSHSTDYEITEFAYPNSPYNWENYPYDYWNLWINPGQCDNTKPGIRCIDWFTSNYDVIIFKHCFPGAGIEEDIGNPQINSSTKSIENYKLQYRALRSLMDGYTNNKFIVWTLAPLHRNATDSATAVRARKFVNWVKNDWLTEDLKDHPNIYIFDFYGYAAESDPSPVNGKVNCLKYAYESDHDGDDSHPNGTANATIMPLFGQFITDVINDTSSIVSDRTGSDFLVFPNPAGESFSIRSSEKYESIELLDLTGKVLQRHTYPVSEIDISQLPGGSYFVNMVRKTSNRRSLLIKY